MVTLSEKFQFQCGRKIIFLFSFKQEESSFFPPNDIGFSSIYFFFYFCFMPFSMDLTNKKRKNFSDGLVIFKKFNTRQNRWHHDICSNWKEKSISRKIQVWNKKKYIYCMSIGNTNWGCEISIFNENCLLSWTNLYV